MPGRSLRGTIPLLLTLAACGREGPAPALPEAPRAPQPTSLVLVTIDTLRALTCSAYGSDGVTTPHVDALARRGVLFPEAYSATDLTNPSHATLLTGLLPATHGVYSLDRPLPREAETLPEELAARGYATSAVVSVYHLRDPMSGLGQGFGGYEVPDVERSAEEAVALASACLGDLPRPFFVWTHLFDPHMPYDPPEPYRSLVLAARPPAPDVPALAQLIERYHVPFPYRDWLATQELAALPALYEAEVLRADHALGRLVRLARRADAGAVVAVTSDHGEGLGEHGIYYNHIGLHEETVRVPLAIHAPGRVPPGLLVAGTFPSHQLYAVLTTLAAGRAWFPRTSGPALCEMRFEAAAALADGATKLLVQRNPVPPLAAGTKLFDLGTDPGELVDAAAAQPDEAARLQKGLEGRLRASSARRLAAVAAPEPDEETLEKLRSLGYVDH